jgi:hypothetical protein
MGQIMFVAVMLAGHPIRFRTIGIPIAALDRGNPWLWHRDHRDVWFMERMGAMIQT